MNMQRKLGLAAVLAAAAVFGGCGGDNDDAPAPNVLTTAPPASAGASSGGLVNYIQSLVAAAPAEADLAEPVDISGFTAPTTAANDLEEPIAPI